MPTGPSDPPIPAPEETTAIRTLRNSRVRLEGDLANSRKALAKSQADCVTEQRWIDTILQDVANINKAIEALESIENIPQESPPVTSA